MTQLESILQNALGADYRLEQEIGGGGMSRLFFATDLRHNRRVVVKVLSDELVTDTSIGRFKREIELTVQLQHPHILPILTSGSSADVLYYITPYIAGESLKDRIARDGKLPLDDIVGLLRDVSSALAFAHSRGVVHRDIKPGNILIADRHAILADFGIAKSSDFTSTALTATGMTPGTPAYMAPELSTDVKADVYALGMVAYEMMCGARPRRGVSTREIIAARGTVKGDDRDRVRALADVICRALSLSTQERTESAQAFADELGRRPRTYGRLAIAAAVVAVVVIGAGVALTQGRRALNADRYVVVSLEPEQSPDGDVERRVTDALGEWRGVSVVDPRLVPRAKGLPFEIADLQKVGKSVGARNVIGIETRRENDSVIVRATLYDALADSSGSRSVTYAVRDSQSAQIMAIRRLVNSSLRDGGELPWRSASEHDTASLAGWRAYDVGRAAIQRWDLAAAEQSLRSAVAAEPRLAPAHLWLAQSLLWSRANALDPRSSTPLEARSSARRAVDLSRRLSPRDSAHAAAVMLLAESRYPEAYAAFTRLVTSDPSDVSGWIGLGDCQAQDHAVIPSPSNRTGWSFRTSFEGAARAYQRAADVGPTGADSRFQGWVLGRLSSVLYQVTNRLRIGQAINADTLTLAALPYLDHDTVAFQPYLARDLATGKFDPPQEQIQKAVQRNRMQLRRAAEEWVGRAPKSGAAYDSLASWIELSGGVGTVGEKQVRTLDVLRRARQLTTDSVAQLRLSIAEVRLLVKDAKFEQARSEADSILRTAIVQSHSDMPGVAGLAALLGYVDRTAQLLLVAPDQPIHISDGSIVATPPEVRQAAGQLLAFAALDVPGDSIRAMARRTRQVIATQFRDSSIAARVGGVLIGEPLTLSYPAGAEVLREIDLSKDLTSRAYSALDRGDTAGARAQLAQARAVSARSTGGTVDASLRRARLAVLLRDTTAALRELDPMIGALQSLAPSLFDQVPQAAAFVRALALRADIADRMLERATAKECASAVVALWRNADAPLQPLVKRMKALANRS